MADIFAKYKKTKIKSVCFGCGENESVDCGFGEMSGSYDSQDFECVHPNADTLECPCVYTYCNKCKGG